MTNVCLLFFFRKLKTTQYLWIQEKRATGNVHVYVKIELDLIFSRYNNMCLFNYMYVIRGNKI